MCGINGIVSLSDAPVSSDELIRTRDYMARRGPDGVGAWTNSGQQVALGHRRLAIIDLSPAAAQPMASADGRFHIVFNGEIYNYRELRQNLEQQGETFRTKSDTEVILLLFARHGAAMLPLLRGMFALAIWDEHCRTLLLARDPFGIKPLYYSFDKDHFRFASQVKALEHGKAFTLEPSPAGVIGFLLWGSVPEPFTIRRHAMALPAGHYLTVSEGKIGPLRRLYPPKYDVSHGQDTLVGAVSDSVRVHLVSDVPVAVFLSAGLDSALVASLARQYLGKDLTTVTVRFRSFIGGPYDEGPLAAKVAKALDTHHVERIVDVNDFPDLWERALAAMDQPTIDGFNTYVISQIAHELGFKVAISGLGGDELFGGYSSFSAVPQLARRARLLGAIPGLRRYWLRLAARVRPQQPKLAGLLDYGTTLAGAYYLWRGLFLPQELYSILSHEFVEEGINEYDPVLATGAHLDNAASNDWERVHLLETRQYMRNQLLRDSDWAAMAHSLELRVPFVDAYLAHSVAALGYEPARSRGKSSVVRQAAPHLPAALWNRPKSGFFIPVMDWLNENSKQAPRRSWGPESRQIAVQVLHEFLQDRLA